MTEIIVNYQWNDLIFRNSKIIVLKREEFGDVSFMIRIIRKVNENEKYDYISLKSLSNDVKINFTYEEDNIRIRFPHNSAIQEFIKENKYALEDFKIYEIMTEPLFKKEK